MGCMDDDFSDAQPTSGLAENAKLLGLMATGNFAVLEGFSVDLSLLAKGSISRVRNALCSAIRMTGWRLYKDTSTIVSGGNLPYWLLITFRLMSLGMSKDGAILKAALKESGSSSVEITLRVFIPYMGYRGLRNPKKIQQGQDKLKRAVSNLSQAFQQAGLSISVLEVN